MKLNEYRLNSMEEPSDELLQQKMERVAIAIRESGERAKQETNRRMQELIKQIEENNKNIAKKQ